MLKTCNFCNELIQNFLPLRDHPISEFMNHARGIGSDVKNYQCPNCGVNDRVRHLKMYLEKTGLIKRFVDSKVLHFSPEPKLIELISKEAPALHILAQLGTEDLRYENVDIESIPYSDGVFDVVIANHILEHVVDPERALREINRVLKPDGFAILQTPYSNLLTNTFEDPGITSEEQKRFFYGQNDHLRFFGLDIFAKFSEQLTPKIVWHKELFPDGFDVQFGVNAEEPFFLYSKKPISGFRSKQYKTIAEMSPCQIEESPQISVLVVTYNHADYIKDALDSILAQRFEGKVEIIVSDDCSTDRTLEILKLYASDHPQLIKVLSSETNQGAALNGSRAYKSCSGRYVALLDGDDFWVDVEKLQKQYQFLESNADYVMCYGSVQAFQGGHIDYNYVGGVKRDLSQAQLICTAPLNTSTVMFRRIYNEFPMVEQGMTIDLVMWSLLGLGGKGHFIAGLLPSVYRIHKGGIHSTRSLFDRVMARLFSNYLLFCFYSSKNATEIANVFWGKIDAEMEYLSKNSLSAQNLKSLISIPSIVQLFTQDICRQNIPKLLELYRIKSAEPNGVIGFNLADICADSPACE